MLQNRVPTDVVNKVGQTNIEFSTFDSNRTKCNSVHSSGHKAENVLDPTTSFGLLSVVCLLLISQRIVALAFLTNTIFYMGGDIFADIRTVCIYNLPAFVFVCLIIPFFAVFFNMFDVNF